LEGGYNVIKKAIEILENNCIPISNHLCEPFMSKWNLYYSMMSIKNTINFKAKTMMDLISYSDGKNTLLEIAEKCNLPFWDLYSIVEELKNKKIIKIIKIIKL